jgi:hypothetical protein
MGADAGAVSPAPLSPPAIAVSVCALSRVVHASITIVATLNVSRVITFPPLSRCTVGQLCPPLVRPACDDVPREHEFAST